MTTIQENENDINNISMNSTNYKLNEGNIVVIKTVQTSAFRVLIEALKDILQDVNIECDETGLKIVAMDVSHTVLVHLKLESKNFEHYHCGKKSICFWERGVIPDD